MGFFLGIISSIIGGAIVGWFIHRFITNKYIPISFLERKDATKSMKEDMKLSKNLIFLGISNTSLKKYLDEPIVEARNKDKKLPWESIDIYFSNEMIGKSWEGNKYNKNIVEVLFKLVSYFRNSDDKNSFSFLKEINFYENTLLVSSGGSLFKYAKDKKFNEISVLYSVAHVKVQIADTKNSNTLRSSFKNKKERSVFNNIFGVYTLIKKNRKLLHTHHFEKSNLWDLSVEQWKNFIQNHAIYSLIINDLIPFINIEDKDNVLELGCGIGNLSERIAEVVDNDGSVTLADFSVNMLKEAKSKLRKFNSINFILTNLKIPDPLYGFIKHINFNKIICHFSFHHLIDNNISVFNFAKTWKDYLSDNGEIILSLHNTALNKYEFPDWEDKLRKSLSEKFKIEFIYNTPVLDTQVIINSFIAGGYAYIQYQKKDDYKRTYSDRISMWKSPAILSSLIKDFSLHDYPKICNFLDSLESELQAEKTAPTEMTFLKFRLLNPRKIYTINAIIINDKGQLLVVKDGDYFLLPGGKKKPYETEIEALTREIYEETDLKIINTYFFKRYNFNRAFLENQPLEMSIYITFTEGIPKPKNEISEIRWLDKFNYSDDESYPKEWWDIIFKDIKTCKINLNI